METWETSIHRVNSLILWGVFITRVDSLILWGVFITRVDSLILWGVFITRVDSLILWGVFITRVDSLILWGVFISVCTTPILITCPAMMLWSHMVMHHLAPITNYRWSHYVPLLPWLQMGTCQVVWTGTIQGAETVIRGHKKFAENIRAGDRPFPATCRWGQRGIRISWRQQLEWAMHNSFQWSTETPWWE